MTPRLRCFGFIEINQFGIRLIDQPVCSPRVVIRLSKFYTDKVFSVIRAGIQIHIPLIALIDPAKVAHLLFAGRAGDRDQTVICKCVRFALITVKHNMLDGFTFIVPAARL